MACILIAGIAAAGVARQSLRMATDSIAAQLELQSRWGVISLQRTLLKGAPVLFNTLEEQARAASREGPYPNSIRCTVMLGGVRFDALLADENAKVNLNYVYHKRGMSHARRLVGQMNNIGAVQVRLMPEVTSASMAVIQPAARNEAEEGEEDPPPPPPAFRHWGQVFDLTRNQGALTGSSLLPASTAHLTCWGRGQINLARAPDKVIEQTCELVLGQGVAQRLIREYRENPTHSIQQIARQMKVDDQDAAELQKLVGTQSWSYSIWLTVSSSSNAQQWFAVSAPTEERTIRTDRFQY